MMMMFLGKGWIIDMLVCGCGQDHITTKKFKKNWEKSPQNYFLIFLILETNVIYISW